MITYSAAIESIEILARAWMSQEEDLPIRQALGRILAADVLSPEQVPSFTNSAMDGFAIHSRDTWEASPGNPVRIRIRGLMAAGDRVALRALSVTATVPGQGVEIMTGAPVPGAGYDSVIRVEDVRVERSALGDAEAIWIEGPVIPGAHIRQKGSDFGIGGRVLAAGQRVEVEHVLACASLGIQSLRVRRLPRFAIISTGSELVPVEVRDLEPGMIRNSTGPFLELALERLGVPARYYGVISDDADLYRRTLERAMEEGADVIVSTGAVSMGKFDFVAEVLEGMGARTHFHKVAIRPGKPLLLGEFTGNRGSSVFFGVPGNPISTAVALRFFIEPYLRAVLGLPRERPVRARLLDSVNKPRGLRCFFKAQSRAGDAGLEVQALKGQASYVVSALMDANAWVVFPEEGDRVETGTLVDLYPLQNAFHTGVYS